MLLLTAVAEKSNLIDGMIDRESDRRIKTEQREMPEMKSRHGQISRWIVFCFQQLCNPVTAINLCKTLGMFSSSFITVEQGHCHKSMC